MSRYYDIIITPASGSGSAKRYTSYPNGKVDPGALRVEMDISTVPFDTPAGAGFIKIWGIPLTDVAQASNLNGASIQVYAGMQKGLPLANPAQAGLIAQGTIQQAFGNWQGAVQTLDLQIVSPNGSPAAPKNIVFSCKKGQQVGPAITQSLQTAFPGVTVTAQVSTKLVVTEDQTGYYQSITQFAQFIRLFTATIVGGGYTGVRMLVQSGKFSVFDGTSPGSPKQIAFNDLIGQVTWIGPARISFKCVMRADIQGNDVVKLPAGQVATTSAAQTRYSAAGLPQGAAFQGAFQVDSVRHVGNSRQADANDWCTVFEAHGPLQAAS